MTVSYVKKNVIQYNTIGRIELVDFSKNFNG